MVGDRKKKKFLLQFLAPRQLPKPEIENYIWSQKYDLFIYSTCQEYICGKEMFYQPGWNDTDREDYSRKQKVGKCISFCQKEGWLGNCQK